MVEAASTLERRQSCTQSVSTKASSNNNNAVAVTEERERIIAALSEHAYHLPGNTSWMQDLWQYLTNNHPVIGICCHHKYHFLRAGPRLVALIGSVCFGLIITNVVYLIFVFTDSDSVYVEWKTNATRTGWQPDLDDNVSVLSVSNVNLVLWTVGAFVHGLFDTAVWSLAACTCLKASEEGESSLRRKRSMGVFVVVELVIFVTAIATLTVALRAAIDNGDDDDAGGDYVDVTTEDGLGNSVSVTRPPAITNITKVEDIAFLEVPKNASDYEFLVAYMIELMLSYFLYYPVIGIILFSGILTCGKAPVLGGRPYELQKERSKSSFSTRSSTARRDSQASRPFDVEEGAGKSQKHITKNRPEHSAKKMVDIKTPAAAKAADGPKPNRMKEGKVTEPMLLDSETKAKSERKTPNMKEGNTNASSKKAFASQSSSALKVDPKQPTKEDEKKKKSTPNNIATATPTKTIINKDGSDKRRGSVPNVTMPQKTSLFQNGSDKRRGSVPNITATAPQKASIPKHGSDKRRASVPNVTATTPEKSSLPKNGSDRRRASVQKKAAAAKKEPADGKSAESMFYAASRDCLD